MGSIASPAKFRSLGLVKLHGANHIINHIFIFKSFLLRDSCLDDQIISGSWKNELLDKEIPVLHPLRAGQPIYPLLKKAVDIKPLEHQLEKAVSSISNADQIHLHIHCAENLIHD